MSAPINLGDRSLIAVKALLGALRHFFITIFLIIIVGFIAYKRVEGLWLFVIGALSGYIQSFVELCIKNYSELKLIAESNKAPSVGATRAPSTTPAIDEPITAWLYALWMAIKVFLKALWVAIKAFSRALSLSALIVFILWLLFNLSLKIYAWFHGR